MEYTFGIAPRSVVPSGIGTAGGTGSVNVRGDKLILCAADDGTGCAISRVSTVAGTGEPPISVGASGVGMAVVHVGGAFVDVCARGCSEILSGSSFRRARSKHVLPMPGSPVSITCPR